MIFLFLLLAPAVPAPANFYAQPTGPSSVALSWTVGSGGFTGFQLDRAQAGAYMPVMTLPNATRAYTDTALAASTQYSYRIRTYKRTGNNTQFSPYVFVTVTTNPSTDPGCGAALIVSGDTLMVMPFVSGGPQSIALVQPTLDGVDYRVPFSPTSTPPINSSTVVGVLQTTTLINGSCHSVGVTITDMLGLTGFANPIKIQVRN